MAHILFVFHSENILSGASRSLMDVIQGLAALGRYRISAVLPAHNADAERALSALGARTYVFAYGHLFQDLNQPALLRYAKKPVYALRHMREYAEAKKAAALLRQEQIDLVYTNTITILFGGYLGRLLGARMIWHIREFGKKDHRIVFYLGERYLERFIDRNADAVLCVSGAVLEEHAHYLDRGKMVVSFNSYSQDFILPRERFTRSGPLKLLLAGDIKPGKGQLEALEALEEISRAGHAPFRREREAEGLSARS